MSNQGENPPSGKDNDNPFATPSPGQPQGPPHEGYVPAEAPPARGGCRTAAGWGAVVLGAALTVLGLIRLALAFTLDVPNLAYAVGYAIGPAIIGLIILGVGTLLLRRPRR